MEKPYGACANRKRRDEKPFALLFPSLEAIAAVCEVSAVEQKWLESQAAPIVLLKKREGADGLADEVAPGLPWIGAMLPYTPLHHLLMRRTRVPGGGHQRQLDRRTHLHGQRRSVSCGWETSRTSS